MSVEAGPQKQKVIPLIVDGQLNKYITFNCLSSKTVQGLFKTNCVMALDVVTKYGTSFCLSLKSSVLFRFRCRSNFNCHSPTRRGFPLLWV